MYMHLFAYVCFEDIIFNVVLRNVHYKIYIVLFYICFSWAYNTIMNL